MDVLDGRPFSRRRLSHFVGRCPVIGAATMFGVRSVPCHGIVQLFRGHYVSLHYVSVHDICLSVATCDLLSLQADAIRMTGAG